MRSFFLNHPLCELSLLKEHKRERVGGTEEEVTGGETCQGWLLFNKLLLRGRRAPAFWMSPAHFCSIVKFMTHAAQLISPPPASSSASTLLLKGLAAARSDLALSFYRSVKLFCTPQDAVLTDSAAPWVFKPLYGTQWKKHFTRERRRRYNT